MILFEGYSDMLIFDKKNNLMEIQVNVINNYNVIQSNQHRDNIQTKYGSKVFYRLSLTTTLHLYVKR